jgi:DNA-binding transcriptional LysR family regulator
MDLHQLRIFQAVLDEVSVTKAAARLHLSPAAVSTQLRNLREELGVDLFVKAGRGVVATQSARELGETTRQLLDLADGIRESFGPKSPTRHVFRLAAGFTGAVYQLSPLLRDLRRLLPDSDIQFSILQTEGIVEGVQRRWFDLGLVSLPLNAQGVRVTPLFTERLALAVHKSACRPNQTELNLRQLAQLPFILYTENTNIRKMIDRFFEKAGIVPTVSVELDNVEGIKRLIAAGFGAAFIPESALATRPSGLRALRISGQALTRELALIEPETAYPRRYVRTVVSFLKERLT